MYKNGNRIYKYLVRNTSPEDKTIKMLEFLVAKIFMPFAGEFLNIYSTFQDVVVHPTVVSENYSSSGMLGILIKAPKVSILNNTLAGKFTQVSFYILFLKGPNNIFPK